jgi:CPA1 family monovalent cation:H+ antiporter
MDGFAFLSLILTTAAVLAWVNHRWVKLPTAIGVLLVALAMSLGLTALDALGLSLSDPVEALLLRFDFAHGLMDIMLAFLLFAGALHVDLDDLRGQGYVIGLLATVGVLATTALVGFGTTVVAGWFGVDLPLLHGMLFGALIAPTDPIAVMGILRTAGVPRSVETKIAGESLFNDGVGVVIFAALAGVAAATSAGEPTPGAGDVAGLLVSEVGGSLLIGLVGGWVAYRMLRLADDPQVEVMITLALASGLYALAQSVHASGPLTAVIAGLFIGNTGRRFGMSDTTRHHVDTFWELIDGILNVILFVLLGMEVLVIHTGGTGLALGLVAIPLVLAARWLSVSGVVALLGRRRQFSKGAVPILTWGGLRGGISVALALSLTGVVPTETRDLLLTTTYVVVIFSVAVQGLTIGKLAKRLGSS